MEIEPDKKTVGLLSKKLVEGWTLLKEECPNQKCKIALVSKDGKMFCVSCESYFKRDANGMIWYARPDEQSTISSFNIKEITKPVQLPPNSPEVQNFPVSSLVNDFGNKQNSSRRLDFSSISNTPGRASNRSLRDNNKVAQKLLEGWNLISKLCSRCSGALVTDKNNRAFCVSCNNYDGTENSISNNRLSNHYFNGLVQKENVTLSFDKEPQMILENTIRSLYDKMESARDLLDKSSNISECNKLVSLITECGNSIKILQSISSHQ